MKKFMISAFAVAALAIPAFAGASAPSGTVFASNPASSAPVGHASTYTNDWGTMGQVSAKCDATKGSTTNTTNWITRTNATFADSGNVSGPSFFASGTVFEGYF